MVESESVKDGVSALFGLSAAAVQIFTLRSVIGGLSSGFLTRNHRFWPFRTFCYMKSLRTMRLPESEAHLRSCISRNKRGANVGVRNARQFQITVREST